MDKIFKVVHENYKLYKEKYKNYNVALGAAIYLLVCISHALKNGVTGQCIILKLTTEKKKFNSNLKQTRTLQIRSNYSSKKICLHLHSQHESFLWLYRKAYWWDKDMSHAISVTKNSECNEMTQLPQKC